ncbi:hypothetical protein BKA57DRAFT_499085 [Linnemannia elongata]|nr:hypothetical protein BKA57DRAFT_499085 [Linnemannia elongata]
MQYSKLLMFVSAVALILLASVPNAATQAAPVPEPMPYSCIDGGIICDPNPAPDRGEIPKWNVSDLLRGITPKSMLTERSTAFQTPQSIAKTVLHKFIGYLETQA